MYFPANNIMLTKTFIVKKKYFWVQTIRAVGFWNLYVSIWNGQKEVELQMVWVLNGIWILVAQPFEILTPGCHFVKKPFENQTIWNPIFKKSGLKMFPDFEWLAFTSPL